MITFSFRLDFWRYVIHWAVSLNSFLYCLPTRFGRKPQKHNRAYEGHMKFDTIIQVIASVITIYLPIQAFIMSKSALKLPIKIGIVVISIFVIFFVWLYVVYLSKRISWGSMAKSARRIADIMVSKKLHPTLIFGIGRGGAIYGSMISSCIGRIPIIMIDRDYYYIERQRRERILFKSRIPGRLLNKVLIVAGDIDTGNTIAFFENYFKKLGANKIYKVGFLVNTERSHEIDFIGRKTAKIKLDRLNLPWRRITKDYEDIAHLTGKICDNDIRMTLYLVRHAETVAGTNVVIGRTDSELTTKGITQAIKLADYFIGECVSMVYSSPSGRALKTALILNHTIMERIIEDTDLLELDYGDWEGKSKKDIANSKLYPLWCIDPVQNIPNQGESPLDALIRIRRFLDKISITHQAGDAVIAVTHRSLIRILVSSMLCDSVKDYRTIEIKNAGVVKLVFDGSKWLIDENEFIVNRLTANPRF